MKKVVVTLLLMIMVWGIGFLSFIYKIPAEPSDLDSKTDAIVVWTGGPCRITTGVALLAADLSSKLFISGVQGSRPFLTHPRCCETSFSLKAEALRPYVTVGMLAMTTKGNALETARWVKKNQFTSIRLVSTAIHLPRSLEEFRKQMPDIHVIPHPVPLCQFNHFNWYCDWYIFKKCALEYTKFVLVKLNVSPQWREPLLEE